MASFQSWDRTADDDSGEGGYFVYVVLRLLLSVFANEELAAHVNSACCPFSCPLPYNNQLLAFIPLRSCVVPNGTKVLLRAVGAGRGVP